MAQKKKSKTKKKERIKIKLPVPELIAPFDKIAKNIFFSINGDDDD